MRYGSYFPSAEMLTDVMYEGRSSNKRREDMLESVWSGSLSTAVSAPTAFDVNNRVIPRGYFLPANPHRNRRWGHPPVQVAGIASSGSLVMAAAPDPAVDRTRNPDRTCAPT